MAYLLSHEQTRCLITRETSDDWGRTLLLLCIIAGLITGGLVINGIGKADQVTTSVTSDGSVMSFSAYRSGDTTITGRIFGSGRTSIDWETETSERLSRLMALFSSGSMHHHQRMSRRITRPVSLETEPKHQEDQRLSLKCLLSG